MIHVCETRDVALLRGLLETDRVGGAYLLGDLEPRFFGGGRWFIATRGGSLPFKSGRPIAIVLVFGAFAEPAVLSFGAAEGVATIVGSGMLAFGPGPEAGTYPDCHLKIPPEHETAFAREFEIIERDAMTVMALDRRDYRPGIGRHNVRRLGESFPVDQILEVYRSYPGHFFEPGQLTDGIYFGSFEGDRLVAVAGTHVFSPAGRVAALGNIVTASQARGRGHAAACTSAVIDALYERGCETIVLHVGATNAPALACYRRLGFREQGPILQMKVRHRPEDRRSHAQPRAGDCD